MFNKKAKIITTLLIAIVLCFYTSYKISYKKFSAETYKSPTTSKVILTDTKSKNNDTKKDKPNPNKKKEDKVNENKNNDEKKKEIPKKTKPSNIENKNYSYENYFNKLKEIGLYKNRFNDENLDFRYAVLQFQSSKNLNCDGIVGPETSKYLMNENNNPSDSVPETLKHGYSMVINKDKRILTVYLDGKVYKKYPVAAGASPSYTPEGKFTIVSKLINPTWISTRTGQVISGGTPQNPLGKRWLGLSIDGGSMYGIHGNNNPWSIGTNVSLGCIRMFNNDVEELFDLIPMNCPIWIGYSNNLNSWGISQK
ncbi:murein L,D-transpeptidase [Clostridium tetani]|uniref:Murein L,D-transpeptidase n=1 Tax=Clostridium tetani TaxID=1513 RepID=A0A4Q0VA11_CLOTA|nr:L,D-transpeptidase [Clostridium tetani]RXI47018.1 murein L,D-transpeptidase [Clostridium tetani]